MNNNNSQPSKPKKKVKHNNNNAGDDGVTEVVAATATIVLEDLRPAADEVSPLRPRESSPMMTASVLVVEEEQEEIMAPMDAAPEPIWRQPPQEGAGGEQEEIVPFAPPPAAILTSTTTTDMPSLLQLLNYPTRNTVAFAEGQQYPHSILDPLLYNLIPPACGVMQNPSPLVGGSVMAQPTSLLEASASMSRAAGSLWSTEFSAGVVAPRPRRVQQPRQVSHISRKRFLISILDAALDEINDCNSLLGGASRKGRMHSASKR